MRVFFALWPHAGVRRALAEWMASSLSECGGRAVHAQNLHATLAFVGEVADERLAVLRAIGARIAAAPCELIIDRIDFWRHNRIVYAGATVVPQALIDLAHALVQDLSRAAFRVETRPWVAHVTLLRNAARAPATDIPRRLSWMIDHVALVESRREDAGVAYRVLDRWTLNR